MGENETEKSAKLVIDQVANISVPVGTSMAKALNNWSSVTRKRNTVPYLVKFCKALKLRNYMIERVAIR
jgi:hypothetical protein